MKLMFCQMQTVIQRLEQDGYSDDDSSCDVGGVIFRCGKCRRYMKLVEAKPARLYCSTCDTTYSLPQNGNIKLYKELRCPLDEFELLLWTTGAKGKVRDLSSNSSVCLETQPYVNLTRIFCDFSKLYNCNLFMLQRIFHKDSLESTSLAREVMSPVEVDREIHEPMQKHLNVFSR